MRLCRRVDVTNYRNGITVDYCAVDGSTELFIVYTTTITGVDFETDVADS